ncbi:MAG: HAD family hydrolase [Lachnospiraceae bacterium]|nr:HAD family hydrolase [Lachnospiraceae bacterium]
MAIFGKKTVTNNIKISFDLDEVLFVSPATHKTEPAPIFPFNIIFKERLRYGAPDLINELQKRGYEVWVYTSSYRTQRYIKCLFRLYGVKFNEIVNAQRHLKEVQGNKKEILPQKIPSKYRISLHIDDETVVATYGKAYGFDVFQLDAQDDDWEEKILERMKQIEKKKFRELEQ